MDFYVKALLALGGLGALACWLALMAYWLSELATWTMKNVEILRATRKRW